MLRAVRRPLTALLAAAVFSVPAVSAQPPRESGSSLARGIVAEINAVRADHGLGPVRLVRPLAAAAGEHSSEMGTHGYFSHDSADGTTFWKRVEAYYVAHGYRYWSVGENLLWSVGALTPAEAVNMWMQSKPHRENLLDKNWRQIGLSVKRFASAPGVYHGLDVSIVTADFGIRY
jgi:uncharacterized protein YkwD